jgi:hopene-associated glycosyltransferase HpnB
VSAGLLLGGLVAAIWAVLIASRFWSCAENDDAAPRREPGTRDPAAWPSVVAVVPARDEVDVIARSLGSLAAQDYPGAFRVILIDDDSSDGTGHEAREIRSSKIRVHAGAPLAEGWTGKLWALHQGVALAGRPDYLWLTDADIAHDPDTLRQLVGIALAGDRREPKAGPRKLVSLMALLHCHTWPERVLVPAFIYFFKMLYPFHWVGRPGPVAGAAGGCVLVERAALERAGGIAAIRGALIDDCTLGRLMKRQGPIWLGMTRRSRSLRPYAGLGEIGAMIARSAYAQLRYNPLLLIGTLLGLMLVFGAPVWLVLRGQGLAQALGIAACLAMAWSWLPVLDWYRRSPLWVWVLPLVAAFYAGCTLWSAWAWYAGRGGMWKGRAQALAGNVGAGS